MSKLFSLETATLIQMQMALLCTILLLFLLLLKAHSAGCQWTLSASQSFSGLSLFIIQCLSRSVLWWKSVSMTFAIRMLEVELFNPIVTQYIEKVNFQQCCFGHLHFWPSVCVQLTVNHDQLQYFVKNCSTFHQIYMFTHCWHNCTFSNITTSV